MIDLSGKLSSERPKIKIDDEHIFEVDNTVEAVSDILDLMSADMRILDMFGKAIERLVGEEAKKEIDDMRLCVNSYQDVFCAILAAAQDEKFEDVQARFQQQQKEVSK